MALRTFPGNFSLSVVVFLVIAAAGIFCPTIPATPAAANDAVVSHQDIECELGIRPCKAIRPEGRRTEGRISLPAIQFEHDSDRLTGTAERQLIELARALGSEPIPPFSFAILGHTDSTGSESYNRRLSLRRARAVKRYLVQRSAMSPERLVEVGLGESSLMPGIPAEDARNRRVEIMNLGTGAGGTTRKRALLIGVDAYRHVSGLLGAPVNDAREMKSFLIRHLGYQDSDIRMLLDADATRDNILAAIADWLVGTTRRGDEVFLYFSGHGFQEADESGDEADGRDETLVPFDTFVTPDRELVGMVTDDEVNALLQPLRDRIVHVVLDSCHSGTATKGDDTYVKLPRLADGTPVRVAGVKGITATGAAAEQESFLASNAAGITVWTASAADQRALVDRDEAAEGRGSVFTRLFLRGVDDGEADLHGDGDGIVTVKELHQYLLAGSRSYCERYPADCASGLTPQLFVDDPRRLDEAAFRRLSLTAEFAKDLLVTPRRSRQDTERGAERVRVGLRPGPQVRIDEEISVVVESNRDGYLVLLDVDAAGRLVQVFPNEHSITSRDGRRIRAGELVILPDRQDDFRFRATHPAGRGVLIAIVADQGPPLQSLVSRHKDLSVIAKPEAYLVELAEALRTAGSAAPEPAPGNDWAVGQLEYQTVP